MPLYITLVPGDVIEVGDVLVGYVEHAGGKQIRIAIQAPPAKVIHRNAEYAVNPAEVERMQRRLQEYPTRKKKAAR